MRGERILGQLHSIHVGAIRQFPAEGRGRAWESGIVKQPVKGAVEVGCENIAGDQQADLVHHGGVDKAILAYAHSHYSGWQQAFHDTNFEPGGFGENLCVTGVTETDCCVGDVWQINDCCLEISQPRQPCWKLSRRWGLKRLEIQVRDSGRTGWYLRVLETGTIQAGDEIRLIDRPYPEVTIAWSNSVMYAEPRSVEDRQRLAACPVLAEAWRSVLLG